MVLFRANVYEKGWDRTEERINITNNENPACESLGIPIRTDHGGKQFKTSGVNSILTPKEFQKISKTKK